MAETVEELLRDYRYQMTRVWSRGLELPGNNAIQITCVRSRGGSLPARTAVSLLVIQRPIEGVRHGMSWRRKWVRQHARWLPDPRAAGSKRGFFGFLWAMARA